MKVIDLVIFRSIGDVLMGTPIAKAVKEKYPEARVRFHTENPYIDLIEGCPFIDEVIGHEVMPITPGYAGIGDVMSVYRYLETHPTDHLAMMAMTSFQDMGWYKAKEANDKRMHMVDFYARRSKLDISPDRHVYLPSISEAHPSASKARNIINGIGKYFCLQTQSGWREKDWPVHNFEEIVRNMEEKGIKALQIGGPNDPVVPGAIDARGKDNARLLSTNIKGTDFKTTMKLLEGSEFFLGLDSGLAYISEGLSKPTFIVMGGTSSFDTMRDVNGDNIPCCPAGPYGPTVHYIEPSRPLDTYCRPYTCWSPCKFKARCIESVTSNQVMDSINKFMGGY